MNINTQAMVLPAGHYREKKYEKKQIVLHFTAGSSANGAYNSFIKSGASTPFIVDRKGIVFQLCDPRCWDSHIYRHEKNEPSSYYAHEKHSVGIEIVNLAYFVRGEKENANTLYTYTNKPYCSIDDTDKYVAVTWKKQKYWQPFTPEQYVAVRNLIQYLGDYFQIPVDNIPDYPRLDPWPTEYLDQWRGVTTHCNYRKDKYDIGPAFNWKEVGLLP